MGRRSSVWIVAGSLFASVALAATPASAGLSSSVSNGVLTVVGGGGEDGVTILCFDTGNVSVNNADPGTGPVPCSSITSITVRVGGGNDGVYLDRVLSVDFPALADTTVILGGGNDIVVGSEVDDAISGGGGDDVFRAGPGDDTLDAGKGHDELRIDTTGDVTLTDVRLEVFGSDQRVRSFEIARIACADHCGVRFDARGFHSLVAMSTGGGADTLIGGSENDQLIGGGGRDRLVGSGGDDWLMGGDGSDVLLGKTGYDRLDGGPGNDTCKGGPGDVLLANCE